MSLELQKFLNKGAVFRRSDGQWVLGFGEFTWLESPSQNEICFYLNDFFLEKTSPWLQFERTLVLDTATLQKTLEFDPQPKMRSPEEIRRLASLATPQGFKLADWAWAAASRNQFSKSFQEVKKAIADKELRKAVPITFESCNEVPEGALIKSILHRLLITEEGLYPYGFWDNESGFIGVSPERLFYRKNGQLETMALAGTRPSKGENLTNLMEDPKEVTEHNLVVEGMENQLAPFGQVEKGRTQEWDIGLLTHLMTPLMVKNLSSNSDSDIINSLHPTPALGTFPQQVGLSWYKNDPLSKKRSVFGAPFGVHSKEEGEYCVAIRNIIWDSASTLLFSGCGVVEASDEEKEWQELYAKRLSVKTNLGL